MPRKLLLTFSLILLLFILALSSSAQESTAITIDTLRVRTAPGYDQLQIDVMPSRIEVVVEGRNHIGDWTLIKTPAGDIRGWVASRYLMWGDGVVLEQLPVIEVVVENEATEVLSQLHQTPIVATATNRARQLYAQGLAVGNQPDRFSKVGDCQSVSQFFLGVFDRGEYHLGADYAHLQSAIDHFQGSYGRDSASVWSGFTIDSVVDPIFADPSRCEAGESPMSCEYRLYRPSFVFISMEVWHGSTADYEAQLREVLDFWVGNNVVPILGTKADNYEGDWSINAAMGRIAREYDIPLWNFMMATYDLPDYGVYDGFHLTFAQSFFDSPTHMENAWPRRNLTALQSLDSVWRGVGGG